MSMTSIISRCDGLISLNVAQDLISSFSCHHHCGSIGVARGDVGKHGCIGNAQAFYAVYFCLLVYNGALWVFTHGHLHTQPNLPPQ